MRWFIAQEARQRGWTVEIGSLEGGLFDSTILHDFRCQKSFEAEAPGEEVGAVDLHIERLEAALNWPIPFSEDAERPWIQRLTAEGIFGDLTFASAAADPGASRRTPAGALRSASLAPGFILNIWPEVSAPPESFELLRVNCRVRRGPVSVQLNEARLTALHEAPGQFLAQAVQIVGPQFENTLTNRCAQTAWKDGQLTLSNLSLGAGLDLDRITLNGAHLHKRQLDWDGDLRALGGSVRSQGTVRFARGHIDLDVAGSLQQVAVRPLALMLGVEGATEGVVEQGQFSFRGDPEHWTRATVSLAGQATSFRWRERRWESLDLAAIILRGRVTVRQLELRQSRNQISLSGECALPTGEEESATAWALAGFTCKVDAKLDDLQSLAQLLAPGLPPLLGRMSVNGSLAARNAGQGLDGYLNVEGSALSVAGAPLDFLRSTLLFQGIDLQIADLQATHRTDYLSGRGTVRIVGAPRYQGELHAAIADLSIYHPAYKDFGSADPLQGALKINWNGDGVPGAHSGAFRGSAANFFTKSGPAHFSRPVTLQGEGTYSPESLSFREVTLKDKDKDLLKISGAFPWTRETDGRHLDYSRTVALRITCDEAPLDLIAEAVNAPGQFSAQGQVGGWLDLSGTPQAPHANGVLQFRKAHLQWDGAPPIENATADMHVEDSLVRIDSLKAQRLGADWTVAGSVDLHQPAHPLLDVSVRSPLVPHAVDNELLKTDAEVNLAARGPWREGEINGEVRLKEATLWRRLELGDAAEGWDQFAAGLPAEWRGDRLVIRVSSNKPLRGAAGGEFTPDFSVGGTGAAPVIFGRVDLRRVTIPAADGPSFTAEAGSIYFNGDQPAMVNLLAKDGAVLLGSVAGTQVVTPDQSAPGLEDLWQAASAIAPEEMWAPDESSLRPAELPGPGAVALGWR